MPLTDLDCAATYKILVLGDTTVGKSSLLRCLTGQEFQGKIRRTIGLYALLLSIIIVYRIDGVIPGWRAKQRLFLPLMLPA